MGEHKTNPRALAAASRPTCATCPHRRDLTDQTGKVIEYTCHQDSPTAFLLGKPGPLGKMVMVIDGGWPTTKLTESCGQHPDFMRWYMTNRADIGAEQMPTEGAA